MFSTRQTEHVSYKFCFLSSRPDSRQTWSSVTWHQSSEPWSHHPRSSVSIPPPLQPGPAQTLLHGSKEHVSKPKSCCDGWLQSGPMCFKLDCWCSKKYYRCCHLYLVMPNIFYIWRAEGGFMVYLHIFYLTTNTLWYQNDNSAIAVIVELYFSFTFERFH